MKPNFKDPIYWLLIICLGLFVAYQCKSKKVYELEAKTYLSEVRAKIEEQAQWAEWAARRVDSLNADRQRIRDSAKVAEKVSKRRIERHEKTTEKLRPEIAARLDSVPVLKAFVASLDSTIQEQKTLVRGMELSHNAEIINLESQLKERGNQVMAEASQKEVWRTAAVEAQKDVRKLQRGKVFRNVVIGVLSAGIVYISLKE